MIQLDWERQDGTLGPIKDLSQFKREVEDMGLELADARLIKSHRECFAALKLRLGRNLYQDEFALEARTKLSKFRKPLREAQFREFVAYLSSPLASHSLAIWSDTLQVRGSHS